jgi:hypothetical protein
VRIWKKAIDRIVPWLLVIRKAYIPKGEKEIEFSFTIVNLGQYTLRKSVYKKVDRFFVGHGIKESKQILGLDRFQTHKRNA